MEVELLKRDTQAGLAAQNCTPSIWKVGAGRTRIQCQPLIQKSLTTLRTMGNQKPNTPIPWMIVW